MAAGPLGKMMNAVGGFKVVLGLAGLLTAGAAAAAFAQGVGQGGVTKVRFGGDRFETRIVIEMDQAASAKIIADGADDRRLVLALPKTGVVGDLEGTGQGLVKHWLAEGAAGGARISLELAQDAEVRRRFLLPPVEGATAYRYVIDLKAKGPQAVPSAGETKLAMATPVKAVKAPPLRLKKVVVIDAGHGGKDPGSLGQATKEKDVVLPAALALRDRLERTGKYRVVMIRDTDTFVPLEERVQIARKADADLFISLHADSGSSPDTRGASVYTLSEKSAGRVTSVLNKSDWFMAASLNNSDRAVSQILLDLTQRSTRNRSAAFAQMLLERVEEETPLLRRSHREAGLVVLLAPDVPAVLLEMGFVTNPDDERGMMDPAKRKRLMDAAGDAIDAYFAQQVRLAAR